MTKTVSKARASASRQVRAEAARRHAQQGKRRRLAIAGVGTGVVAIVAVVVVAVSSGGGGTGGSAAAEGPLVGGDLHALAALDGSIYVSGHGGAGVSTDGGRTWQQISSLDDKDGMGWAVSGNDVLVGGHPGLYRSTNGEPFTAVSGLPVSDIHGLGGAGQSLYVASPQGGIFASTDAGRTWQPRGTTGAGIMGTILVDPNSPNHLIAPDMNAGVVASTNGGRTWSPLGGPAGPMSVARSPVDVRELVAVGMDGAQRSSNAGREWAPMTTPAGTSAVVFDPTKPGRLLAAALSGDRAVVFASDDDGATWTRTARS